MSELRTIFRRNLFPEKRLAFVLMPFREPYDSVYDRVIRPTVESCKFDCNRADKIYSGNTVIGDVWNGIQQAELIIAELSGKNENVMYELGLSHALWRKTILITQRVEDVPFDLRSLRLIVYSSEKLEELSKELEKFIRAIAELPTDDPILAERSSVLNRHVYFDNNIVGTEFSSIAIMEAARKEVTVFGPNLSFWFNNEEAKASLLNHIQNGKRLILVMSTWEPLAAFGGSGTVDLKKSIGHLIRIISSLSVGERSLLSVRFHLSVSTLSGVISDPQTDAGRLCLTLRLADEHNSAARFFVGLRRDLQRDLFDKTTAAFFNLRYLGEDITPEEMLQRGIQGKYIG